MNTEHYRAIARRTTVVLLAGQSLGSAGIIAAATINTIVGAKLSGHPSWAGVPTAVYQIGAALAAFGWGYGMDRLGRRGGLTLGLAMGVVGAAIASGAVIMQSFIVFSAGLVLMGVANSALQLARFAAAEVHPPDQRGRAISNVVIGGTVGAVFGPLVVGPMGKLAQQYGFDELAGPYVITFVLFAIAALLIFLTLKPDPRDVGKELAAIYDPPSSANNNGVARTIGQILRAPAALVAISAMVFGQAVMVMLMVITSLHMKDHQHELTDISLVISSHVVGMFAFSIISGRLADKWGRGPVILVGASTLILACLLAPLSPDVLPLGISLFLLGLGWNFCYVGGSSLLADQLTPTERARTQGFNDLLIGLVSATGSLGSGVVFAAVGYGAMGVVGAVAAIVPLVFTLWWQISRQVLAPAPSTIDRSR